MEELGKYCYDFCKEAKKGDLIIASPYQEAAKSVSKVTPHLLITIMKYCMKRQQSVCVRTIVYISTVLIFVKPDINLECCQYICYVSSPHSSVMDGDCEWYSSWQNVLG